MTGRRNIRTRGSHGKGTPKWVLKKRNKNIDYKKKLRQRLGDEQVTTDLKSGRNHCSAERPVCWTPSRSKNGKRTSIPHIAVVFSYRADLSCVQRKAGGYKKPSRAEQKTNFDTAEEASVNTKRDRQKEESMVRSSSGSDSVKRREVELKSNWGE